MGECITSTITHPLEGCREVFLPFIAVEYEINAYSRMQKGSWWRDRGRAKSPGNKKEFDR